MIVRDDGDNLLLFRQSDHAALSGDIAARWGNPSWQVPEPRVPVVAGARLHDDAWLLWDEEPAQREDGRPQSFAEVDRVTTTAMYTHGIESVLAIDPYAGLLVSLHFSGFFHGHWDWVPFAPADRFAEPEGAAIRLFVRDELTRQAELRARLYIDRTGPQEVRLAAHYKWLQLWDRISLDVCRQDPSSGFTTTYPAVPVHDGAGADHVELSIAIPDGGRCQLDPYPLASAPFRARLPVVRLPREACADRATFLGAWRLAPIESYEVLIEPA